MAHPIPPYGVAIQDAIASGDQNQMRSVAEAAEAHLNEIREGLQNLHAAMGSPGGGGYGGGPIPLYGVVIRGAMESGDRGQMESVRQQANDYLSRVDEVRAALQELEGRM